MLKYYFKLVLIALWSLILPLLAFPIALVYWKGKWMNTYFFRIYAAVGAKLAGFEIDYQYSEWLRNCPPCLIVMNHQSAMDFMTFPRHGPYNTAVIGKKSMGWIPIFGWFFVACGNILIDRKNHSKSVDTLQAVSDGILKRGMKIGIFPEGTRNKNPAHLLNFKKGAFYVAAAGQIPILPMVCSSLKPAFDPAKKKFPGGKLKVRVLPLIYPKGNSPDSIENLRLEVQNQMQAVVTEFASTGAK